MVARRKKGGVWFLRCGREAGSSPVGVKESPCIVWWGGMGSSPVGGERVSMHHVHGRWDALVCMGVGTRCGRSRTCMAIHSLPRWPLQLGCAPICCS